MLLVAASEITAWVTLVAVLIGAGLKIWALLTTNEETKAKLEKAQDVVGSIGEAINEVTPVLGVDKAKLLKTNVASHARSRNVVEELDELVEKYHLNDRATAEIANPHDP